MTNKNINIDDLFRDAFENFEKNPPEHVWKNIQKSMHGDNGGTPGKIFPKGGILGVGIIFILSSLFFIYQSNNSNSQISNVEKIALNSDIENIDGLISELQQNKAESKPENFAEKGLIEVSAPSSKVEMLNKRGTDATMIVHKKPINEVSSNTIKNSKPELNEVLVMSSGNISFEEKNLVNENRNELLNDGDLLAFSDANSIQSEVKAIAPVQEEDFETGPLNEMVELNNGQFESGEIPEPELRSDYGKRGNLSLGLYFTPEVIFYPSDINTTNKSYSIDLNLTYKFSNYLIQSGIGVATSSDDGRYKVDFEEFLGSYEDVYDVTFDSTSNGVIPVYHTETVNVYDTIQHVSVTPTKNKYTYLQIPILFGYTEEFRRFSWFVKGGPSISIMVNENISSVNLENDNSNIISVDNDVPSRINANWQFVLSGGITYKLGNHISIGIEPMMRFYMKSAYRQNTMQTKYPYSFGLRSGIIVNF